MLPKEVYNIYQKVTYIEGKIYRKVGDNNKYI